MRAPDYLDFWKEEYKNELWWDRKRRMSLLKDILPDLVALVGIPEPRGKFLLIFVRSSLQHAWDLHNRKPFAGFPHNLIAASKAMRVAMDALSRLDEKELDLLESELDFYSEMGLDDYLGGEISDVADALKRSADATASMPKRGGRPKGKLNANNESLQSFIVHFYRGVVKGCSGKLSINPKNGGSGKLIRALRLLEPCLPPGFLPKVLPAKSIDGWIRGIKRAAPKTPEN